jgi:hypothetical protein
VPYKRHYRFKVVRNLLIASVFVTPFLAFYRLDLIYLTLVPFVLVEAIMLFNYKTGNGPSLKDPVGMREGFIEVDQYPSWRAVLHDDRFISFDRIESV